MMLRQLTTQSVVLLPALLICHAVAKRSLNLQLATEPDFKVYFPPGSKLSWQGTHLSISPEGEVNFTAGDLHRGFLWTHPHGEFRKFEFQSQNFAFAETFIYMATSSMCGASLFSQPELSCKRLTYEAAKGTNAFFAREVASRSLPLRAFGVELEFVARDPTWQQARRFDTELDPWDEALKYCFLHDKTQGGRDSAKPCDQHLACPLGEYCRKEHKPMFRSRRRPYCKASKKCLAEKSVDGSCPVSFDGWKFVHDGSVKPLTLDEAREAGAADPWSQTKGVSFELVSPILSGSRGMRSIAEVLATLRDMGVQAGPSQGLHMHVNAANDDVDGSTLGAREIHNVWVHYARFQLVINEMLQDSRTVGNGYFYSMPLTLLPMSVGMPSMSEDTAARMEKVAEFEQRRLFGVGRIFANLQACTQRVKEKMTPLELCQCALGEDRCSENRPSFWRYFQINLHSLARHRTLEFRAFPSTSDPERALRWALFVLSFVERYKEDDAFLPSAGPESQLEQRIQLRWEELQQTQRSASLKLLEEELGMDMSYWRDRPWLRDQQACQPVDSHL